MGLGSVLIETRQEVVSDLKCYFHDFCLLLQSKLPLEDGRDPRLLGGGRVTGH